jgi:hypothetical protein
MTALRDRQDKRGRRSWKEIFHFPFVIFHLSFLERDPADDNDKLQMTNRKSQMTNGKWKISFQRLLSAFYLASTSGGPSPRSKLQMLQEPFRCCLGRQVEGCTVVNLRVSGPGDADNIGRSFEQLRGRDRVGIILHPGILLGNHE